MLVYCTQLHQRIIKNPTLIEPMLRVWTGRNLWPWVDPEWIINSNLSTFLKGTGIKNIQYYLFFGRVGFGNDDGPQPLLDGHSGSGRIWLGSAALPGLHFHLHLQLFLDVSLRSDDLLNLFGFALLRSWFFLQLEAQFICRLIAVPWELWLKLQVQRCRKNINKVIPHISWFDKLFFIVQTGTLFVTLTTH